MGVPIINKTQSVLDYLQHQAFAFQPYATGSPTSWTSGPLPAGLALTAGTGLISGTPTVPGVYAIALKAHNAEGASAEVVFYMGIEASVQDPTANVIDLIIDLGTRQVSAGPLPASEFSADVPLSDVISTEDAKKLAALGPALFQAKRGDQLLFRVQFRRAGVAATITCSDLKLALKEFEPEAVLETSSDFHSLGGGIFLVYVTLESDALKGALSNYEGNFGTHFPGVWEFTWLAANGHTADIGPANIRGSSRNFRGDIVRDVTE